MCDFFSRVFFLFSILMALVFVVVPFCLCLLFVRFLACPVCPAHPRRREIGALSLSRACVFRENRPSTLSPFALSPPCGTAHDGFFDSRAKITEKIRVC